MRGNGAMGGYDRFDLARQEPVIDVWLAKRILAGWTPQAIAKASCGSVSTRTAYRWKAELVALEEVSVDGWTAWFARRRRQPPKRISAWTRVAAARVAS